MSLGRCQPMFDELLLLLQPLSVLPFDLNLLLEPRLLRNRQLCLDEQGAPPPQPCSALLVTSWPLLQADRQAENSRSLHQTLSHKTDPHPQQYLSSQSVSGFKHDTGAVTQSSRSPVLAPIPEWWPTESDLLEGGAEREDCSQNNTDDWSQISMDSRQEERRGDNETPNAAASVQTESPCQGGLRWAKLFGAADTTNQMGSVYQSQVGAQSR